MFYSAPPEKETFIIAVCRTMILLKKTICPTPVAFSVTGCTTVISRLNGAMSREEAIIVTVQTVRTIADDLLILFVMQTCLRFDSKSIKRLYNPESLT
ncbi:hypothetical protein TNCV_715561 [Trichonephila clavipes]|nr:hypothetical protein TNCV_715561 [Trichonephila clavipes]